MEVKICQVDYKLRLEIWTKTVVKLLLMLIIFKMS